MRFAIETITKQRADELLAMNHNNRPLRERYVADLCSRLQRGEWKLNGEAIKVNGHALVDGQHRCTAVSRTGIPIESLVVYGLPDDIAETLDTGRGRSPSDVLSMRGEKHAAMLAAAASWLLRYYDGNITSHRQAYTHAQIIASIEQHPGIRHSVKWVGNCAPTFIKHSGVAAMHYLCSQSDRDAARVYFEALFSGEGLTKHDPAYRVREAFIANRAAMRKVSHGILCAYVIKGWNCYINGTPLKVLRQRPGDDFPAVA